MIDLGFMLMAIGLMLMGGMCFIMIIIVIGTLLYQHMKGKENGKDRNRNTN